MRKYSIDVTPEFCIFWAVLLLILPLRWIAAAVAAAFFHECCHLLMLKRFGVSVLRITIDMNGAMIETGPMRPYQELLCACAGPAGSFLLLSLIRWFPLLSICAGIQGAYNLIPVMPFDGGRVLKSFLDLTFPGYSHGVMSWVHIAVCCFIVLAGILGSRFGVFPMIVSLIMLRKMLPRKRPCKEGLKRVQ